MRTDPVHFESFPAKWDPVHAQKVMESNLRRVLAAVPEQQTQTAQPKRESSDVEAQLFVGVGSGRQIIAP